jgi:hypothetical protein
MQGRFLLVLAIAIATTPAHAGSVGIVVTGDVELQPVLTKQLEGWLRGHGHGVGPALSPEATNTLLNCMLIDDQGCARGVVEAQAKTDSVLTAHASKSRTSKATLVSINWLQKGKEPVGMRRACEDCTNDLMKSTVEEMLAVVVTASQVARGRLELHSKPAGMTVLLDNENIGVTPLEREVPAGEHTIVLMHRGRKVGERKLKIHAEVTAEINIPVTIPKDEPTRSRVVPGLVLGTGGVALTAGVLLFVTSEIDDGTKPTYRDTKPLGIGVAAGGAVLVGIGAWLWLRGGPKESTPIVAIDRAGGMVGWARAF